MAEHHLFRTVTDPFFGILGFLAIDTAYRGESVGGIRILPDVTREEISEMALTQTRKYLFSGVPMGGAKAGLVLSRKARQRRDEALLAFGRQLSGEIRSGFWPGCDMGSSERDVRMVLLGAGVPSLSKYPATGMYTAMGLVSSIDAALELRGMGWSGLRIAIEGYGTVGSALAGMAARKGARIVSVSNTLGCISGERGLDVPLMDRLKKEHGNSFITRYPHHPPSPKEKIFRARCDVFVPCARCWSVNGSNANLISAGIIACGANVPMTPETERGLWKRGKLIIPDAVANCGGVVGGCLSRFMPDCDIRNLLDARLRRRVIDVLNSEEAPSDHLRDFCRRRRDELAAELAPVKKGALDALSGAFRFHFSDRLFGKGRALRGLFPD